MPRENWWGISFCLSLIFYGWYCFVFLVVRLYSCLMTPCGTFRKYLKEISCNMVHFMNFDRQFNLNYFVLSQDSCLGVVDHQYFIKGSLVLYKGTPTLFRGTPLYLISWKRLSHILGLKICPNHLEGLARTSSKKKRDLGFKPLAPPLRRAGEPL